MIEKEKSKGRTTTTTITDTADTVADNEDHVAEGDEEDPAVREITEMVGETKIKWVFHKFYFFI